jgi:hypothetical protein
MAILLQVTCFILVLAMAYARSSSSYFDESNPSRDFDEHFDDDDDDWSSLSTFEEFNKMMAIMDQQYKQMSAFASSFFKAQNNDMTEIKKKLDDVAPVCTTTGNSSTTSTIPTTLVQKIRRKQFRPMQTTTCIKEMIIDGTKYMYNETKVTDDQGIIVAQSNNYQSFTINQINNTTMPNITE